MSNLDSLRRLLRKTRIPGSADAPAEVPLAAPGDAPKAATEGKRGAFSKALFGAVVVCLVLFFVLSLTDWPWRYTILFLLLAFPLGVALFAWSAACDLLAVAIGRPVGERTRQFLGFQFIGLLTLGVLTLDLPGEAPEGQVLLVFLFTVLLAGLLPALWPNLDWRKPLLAVVVAALVLRLGMLLLLHVPALNASVRTWAGRVTEELRSLAPDTAITPETIADPQQFAFFGADGQPAVFYLFLPGGELRLYRQDGVDRASGLPLQPVTPAARDRIVAWLQQRRDQQATQQTEDQKARQEQAERDAGQLGQLRAEMQQLQGQLSRQATALAEALRARSALASQLEQAREEIERQKRELSRSREVQQVLERHCRDLERKPETLVVR